MKVLFIGGTGNISTAVSKLAVSKGIDLTLLQRGNRGVDIPSATYLTLDIKGSEQVAEALRGQKFDAVVNWIGFNVQDVERDDGPHYRCLQKIIKIASIRLGRK